MDDIPAGSVDLVFATNVMHFSDRDLAMKGIAKQLKSDSTFAAALFGPARFEDATLQNLWERVNYQGGRMILAKADQPEQTITIMARTQGKYNVAPLDPWLFRAGAKRVHLNMTRGGITGMLPPKAAHRNVGPDRTGLDDIESHEDDDGWSFTTDLEGVKEHIASFPFLALTLRLSHVSSKSWKSTSMVTKELGVTSRSGSSWPHGVESSVDSYRDE